MTTIGNYPDLQTQIARIVHDRLIVDQHQSPLWDKASPAWRQRCESAAVQITALLKPQAGVDREAIEKAVDTLIMAAHNYQSYDCSSPRTEYRTPDGDQVDFLEVQNRYRDELLALIDAIAPVKLPTQPTTTCSSCKGSGRVNTENGTCQQCGGRGYVIAAGFATEDNPDPPGPEEVAEWYRTHPHPELPTAPPPAADSEREEEQFELAKIVVSAYVGKKVLMITLSADAQNTWLRVADAVLAAGFRRQPEPEWETTTVSEFMRDRYPKFELNLRQYLESLAPITIIPDPEREPEPAGETESIAIPLRKRTPEEREFYMIEKYAELERRVRDLESGVAAVQMGKGEMG